MSVCMPVSYTSPFCYHNPIGALFELIIKKNIVIHIIIVGTPSTRIQHALVLVFLEINFQSQNNIGIESFDIYLWRLFNKDLKTPQQACNLLGAPPNNIQSTPPLLDYGSSGTFPEI